MVAQLRGKIFPDGSVSIGRVAVPKIREIDAEYERDYNSQYYTAEYDLHKYGGTYEQRLRSFRESLTPNRFNKCPESSQAKKTTRYGLNGITGYGRKMLRSGASILERKYKKNRLGFVTVTLPNFTKSRLSVLCRNWSEIVRRFFQKIRRIQLKTGAPTDVVSCTEIQPNRFLKKQQFAPHLHFVYVCRRRTSDKKFEILAWVLRRFWRETLTQILDREDMKPLRQITWSVCIEAVCIKKSVVRYLSKYLSKGGDLLEQAKKTIPIDCIPKQWWSANRELKKEIKENVIELTSEECKEYYYYEGDMFVSGRLTWFDWIEADIKGEKRIVGFVGKISDDYYLQLLKKKRQRKLIEALLFVELAISRSLSLCMDAIKNYIKNLLPK